MNEWQSVNHTGDTHTRFRKCPDPWTLVYFILKGIARPKKTISKDLSVASSTVASTTVKWKKHSSVMGKPAGRVTMSATLKRTNQTFISFYRLRWESLHVKDVSQPAWSLAKKIFKQLRRPEENTLSGLMGRQRGQQWSGFTTTLSPAVFECPD